MKRRWLILGIGILLLLGVAAWFEPTCAVRGWLRGEAFYQGRPTSYWSRELRHWQQFDLDMGIGPLGARAQGVIEGDAALALFLNEPPLQDGAIRWQNDGWDSNIYQRTPGLLDKLAGYFGITLEHPARPAVVDGDPDAEPVLQELLQDPDPQIVRHATIGIRRIQHPPGLQLWNEFNARRPR